MTSVVRKIFPSYLTGAVLAVIGYYVCVSFVYTHIGIGHDEGAPNFTEQGIAAGFIGLVAGWMIGIGALKNPFVWLLGLKDPDHKEEERLAGKGEGVWRYFRFTTDHKVVGVQYLVLVSIMLCLGGIGAVLIRSELLRPGALLFPTETYNTIVTMHGMMMILATISMFIGPFGNFVVPIMIGARDMAFPRLNALSFAFLLVGVVVFMFIPFLGGAQTGWTVYAPLADQTQVGMTALDIAIILAGTSSVMGAVNIITTIVTMRAPGMTWTRVPMFVWGIMGSAILAALGTAAFTADLILILMDRLYDTTFFVAQTGGNSIINQPNVGGIAYLSQNLFWFFGHPEVYLIVLPAFGLVLEVLPVFARKTIFGYKMAVLGILGVVVLSFLVWMHHEFVSGFLPDIRGFYMATTELISVPTGFIFLGALGTIWRGKLWLNVPMAFALAFLWNFLIGGISGIFLSDVPADIQLHGGFFVTAHFHYTMVGGALWGFFAAMYYWFPKITGRHLNEQLGWIHFWGAQIGFNVAFIAMFVAGLQGLPRRVADYDPRFAPANFITSIFAYLLVASIAVFFYNVIHSWVAGEKAVQNPWAAQTLEWSVPTPVPLENFPDGIPVVTSAPYNYGGDAAPVAVTPGGQAAG